MAKLTKTQATFRKIIRDVKTRKKDWWLTFEQWEKLAGEDCFYCGLPPSNEYREFKYQGIDRINSKGGYEVDNVLPCCKHCNAIRGTMDFKIWLTWLNQVKNVQSDFSKFELFKLDDEKFKNRKTIWRGR